MSAIETDPVFLGLTRPAMMMGVTQSFFIINGMVNLVIFLAVNSFLPVFILFPLLHGIGYLACLKDPRTFDLWMIYVKTSTKCKNKAFWGSNSYDLT